MRSILLITVLLLTVALLAMPASAIKVYVNPSVQTNNTSPDGTYNEGYSMQTVADLLVNKLSARGFSTRDSNWLSLSGACSDAVSWDADSFVALHSNAMGSAWQTGARGTEGYYYTSSGGWYDPVDQNLCDRCVHKCVDKFAAWSRGYDRGTFGDYPRLGYNLYVLANTPGMNSVLVESLFHDNSADVAVLKTDAGKDAYAQAIYEALCDFYGWSYNTVSDIVIDNTSGSFSCSANWTTGSSATDKYGTDYRYRSTAAVSDAATWTPNIPVAGNWQVYAWWSAGTNRSASAPYIINYNGGSATVPVNQQGTGGQWVSLGTYNFAAGTGGNVRLSCWTTTGYVVIADAVKFVKR